MFDLIIRNGTIIDGTGKDRFTGDVAVKDGVIAAVGNVEGDAKKEIDATGMLVTPGFVDIHTHYDGQVTWDPYLSPSSWHGVTTVVMGNCGVGFAPLKPGKQDFLVELMEGVEDIPGTALHEGMKFNWETFPEYLDVLDAMPRAIDVAAQVPHCAVRAYVLGERAHETDITEDEMQQMADITKEAMDAGAVGFSTSRTILHRSVHGLTPGTYSHPQEMMTIGKAIGDAGHGIFQLISDNIDKDDELKWVRDFTKETGRPLTYLLAQSGQNPNAYKVAMADAKAAQAEGMKIIPQVPARPTGMLFGLQSSLHPFMGHPSFHALNTASLEEKVAKMNDPAFKAQLLSEENQVQDMIAKLFMTNFAQMFRLGDPPDYEPAQDTSAQAIAEKRGVKPEEIVYEWLLERDGQGMIFAPLASYVDFNLDAIGEMMSHPSTVLGLSDGGAHCGLICDVSMPTYMLTHWGRDRTRGETMPLEKLVNMQTQRTAETYEMYDRGVLAVGKKADINIIDFDKLTLHAPEMVHDFPASARRLVQRATGYKATIVAGELIFEDGEATGQLPGKLVRQRAEVKLAAE